MSANLAARDLVHLLFEAVNAGRLEVIDEIYSPDFVDRAPGPGQGPGPTGITQAVETYLAAIPDLHVEVEDVVQRDRGAARTRLTRAPQVQADQRSAISAGCPCNGHGTSNVTRSHRARTPRRASARRTTSSRSTRRGANLGDRSSAR